MRTITASEAIRTYHFAVTRTLDEFLPEPVTYVDGIYQTYEQACQRLGMLAVTNLTGTFEIVRISHEGEACDG